jgi:hypothetical protein
MRTSFTTKKQSEKKLRADSTQQPLVKEVKKEKTTFGPYTIAPSTEPQAKNKTIIVLQ